MSRPSLAAVAGRHAVAAAVLGMNRIVWWLVLGVWLVVLAAGTYLDRVHLQGGGAFSLGLTALLGLAYVLTQGENGRRLHRGLGIAANALLAAELAVYFAHGSALGGVRLLGGTLVALVVLGIPLLYLIAVRPDEA